MQRRLIVPVTVALLITSCMSEEERYYADSLKNCGAALNELSAGIREYRRSGSLESLKKMRNSSCSPALEMDFTGYDLDGEQAAAVRRKTALADSLRGVADALCNEFVQTNRKALATGDILVDQEYVLPMYLKKGTELHIACTCQGQAAVKFYNADIRALLKTFPKGDVSMVIPVSNDAVYLLEITAPSPCYCSLEVNQKVNDIAEFDKVYTFDKKQVETTAGGFRARKIPGVDLKPVFEEPHKYTIRSRGKFICDMSSPFRSVAAVKIPAGTTDILYHLRISTNDDGSSSDGRFFNDVSTKYKKIKMLGLPVYESNSNGSNILRELLNSASVQREEKAYCNLYVFRNQAQARKFQNNAKPEFLTFDMDHSASGTQSRNERIPVSGAQTIYLGFENTRLAHDIYLWLEVVASVTSPVYYSDEYVICR